MARRYGLRHASVDDVSRLSAIQEFILINPTVLTTPVAAVAAKPAVGFSPAGRGSLADLLHMLGDDLAEHPDARDAAAQLAVGLRRVPAGQHLIQMGALSVALYFVHTGTFKIARSDEDGYEQVLALAGRGEVIGYDALCVQENPTSAVALEDSTVYVVLRSDLATFSRQVPAFGRELHRTASLALARTNDLVDVMAAVSSEVRLARFLLQLSRQMTAKGQSSRRFILRMGRRDLASMLGVAHETVSRAFTTLSMARLLHVNDRDVEILDIEGLRAFSRCTRRPQEEAGLPRARRLATQRGDSRAAARLQALPA
ncbi:MAG: hypothetical protein CVU22_23600 [Betaproteobacteria bacterium HGW-Betaproteobacteria-16]|nr:MAG: hypothetical protein CVU22_23600 [Betaproteobacteria bacterium HGW-Betaproteobacteria-16]